VVRILYLALGVLSLLPFSAAIFPPIYEHFGSPPARDAFLSIDYLTREVPLQWLDPWVTVSIVSGLILAIAFSILMRRLSSPTAEYRPIWVVLLFGLAPFALPVFWYCYLRTARAPTSNTSLERTREG
jgi:hypothetical protein